VSLDLLLIDDLHDIAKKYYILEPAEREESEKLALQLMFTQDWNHNLLYMDIFHAFKMHYKKLFYEKQKELTLE